MVHQTFDGAIAETGSRLTGLSASPIEKIKPRAVWAGDVHKPQTCGPVTYVGAPYHCRFGDDYVPRVILATESGQTDLHFPSPRKLVLHVNQFGDIKGNPGDQAKIIAHIDREACVSWGLLKQELLAVAKEKGLEVHGLEMRVNEGTRKRIKLTGQRRRPADILGAFCRNEGLAENLTQTGMELLK